MPADPLPQPTILQALLSSTAAQASVVGAEPPLSLFSTTPVNFARFVTRIGVARRLQDEILNITTWKDPSKTLVYMLVTITFCLYPILVVVLPQAVLIYIIIQKYYAKAKAKNASSITKETSTSEASSAKTEYLKNMTYLQNFMGAFSDFYDAAMEQLKIIDWSDEKKTNYILRVSVGSAAFTLFIARFIPTRVLFLMTGLTPFIVNTPLFAAIVNFLPSFLKAKADSYVQRGRSLLGIKQESHEEVLVRIYENQRWWAGLGWIPHLLPSERGAWTDESGTTQLPDLETTSASIQAGWEWVDAVWTVGKPPHSDEEEGWIYTDHFWASPRKSAGIASLTRRRVWMRLQRRVGGGADVSGTDVGEWKEDVTPPPRTPTETTMPRAKLVGVDKKEKAKGDISPRTNGSGKQVKVE